MTQCKHNKHSYCIGRKCKYSEPEVGCILNELDDISKGGIQGDFENVLTDIKTAKTKLSNNEIRYDRPRDSAISRLDT